MRHRLSTRWQNLQVLIGLGRGAPVLQLTAADAPILYAAAIMLAFVSPWISIAIYAMVAVMWLVPDRRIENVLREKRSRMFFVKRVSEAGRLLVQADMTFALSNVCLWR
jgi:hypothetical protein